MSYGITFLILAGVLLSIGHCAVNKKLSPCSTKACLDKANEMLAKMDRTVNPCDSFYDFACGNFMKQELSSGEISRSALDQTNKNLMAHLTSALQQPISSKDSKPVRNAKYLYQSCIRTDLVDQTSEQYLAKFISDELGGWPMATDNPFGYGTISSSRLSSVQLLTRLAEFRVQPLVSVTVVNHPKKVNARVIKIKQPQLLPPQMVMNPQYQIAFQNYVRTLLSYLSPVASRVADLDIAAIGDLGNKLSMVAVNPVVSMKAGYKNMTIRQLQYYIPKFPWKEFLLNGVFNAAGVSISDDEYVLVEDWDYLTKAAEIYALYSTYNKKTLDNFMILSFVNQMAIDYMPSKYLQLKQYFMQLLTGVSQVQERSTLCASSVNTLMSFVTSRMYIDSFFDKNIKPKVTTMTDTIINAFKSTLDEVPWLDTYSRTLAHGKVDTTKTRVAYPDNIFDDNYLNQLYNFDLDGVNYLKNAAKITYSLTIKAYSSLNKLRNREEWIFPPTFVNPFYDRESNEIVLPAAILNAPFYDENIPNYLNFGAIGSIIGHELTHGFDDAGRHFDKNGLFYFDSESGLWTSKTIQTYANRTDCMVQQYNNYKDTQVNMNVNGALTLNENIADSSGIRQSFKAYQKWKQTNGEEAPLPKGLDAYTHDQMFFVSMAQIFCAKVRPEAKQMLLRTDNHSPAEFRILGSTSNSPEFAKAFNCKAGQTNNPVKKCPIW